jgi:hypothetical protein
MGRGAGQLIPLLTSDIGGLEQQMRKMGAIMSGDVAVKLKDLHDRLTLAGTILIAQFAPAILQAAKVVLQFADIVARAAQFIANKTGLSTAAATVGAVYGQTGSLSQTIGYFVQSGLARIGAAAGGPGVGQQQANINQRFGVDPNITAISVKKGVDAGNENIRNILDGIEGALKALKTPAAQPGGGRVAPDDVPKIAKAIRVESNELIRTGNFMGASKDALTTLQQQAVAHAATTANNTAMTNKLLEQLVGKGPLNTIPFGAVGHRDSIFPVT